MVIAVENAILATVLRSVENSGLAQFIYDLIHVCHLHLAFANNLRVKKEVGKVFQDFKLGYS